MLDSSLGINKPRRDPAWVGFAGGSGSAPPAPRVPPHPRECIPISVTGGHTIQHVHQNPQPGTTRNVKSSSLSRGQDTGRAARLLRLYFLWGTMLVAQMVKNPSANAGDSGDEGSIPDSGHEGSIPGSGILWRTKWQPLQYSSLGNSMGRGAWWATADGVTKIRRRLSDQHTHTKMPTS